jgi:hypothetical protein
MAQLPDSNEESKTFFKVNKICAVLMKMAQQAGCFLGHS